MADHVQYLTIDESDTYCLAFGPPDRIRFLQLRARVQDVYADVAPTDNDGVAAIVYYDTRGDLINIETYDLCGDEPVQLSLISIAMLSYHRITVRDGTVVVVEQDADGGPTSKLRVRVFDCRSGALVQDEAHTVPGPTIGDIHAVLRRSGEFTKVAAKQAD